MVIEGHLGEVLLEPAGFGSQLLDLIGRCLTGHDADEPLLAGFEELLGRSVVEVLGDALLTAKFGDAVLAAQAAQNDADIVLDRERPSGDPPDVSGGLLRPPRSLRAALPHRVPSWRYDEPAPISYAISSICPLGLDGKH